ncbi:MAG: S9 family peptidase, partial [Saprospiraceae bacterium]|nr:S9 family peptidase [Saprospiraceae bacterium]
ADRNRIFIADLSTNVKEEVTVGVDREANNVIWANDSKTLYYIGGDKATFQIFAIDINQKQERELTQGDHDYHSIVLAGDQILASRMDMANPIELFHINTRNGQQKQVTFTNKAVWENIKKAKVEKRFIKTTDGKDMLVWVIFPPNFDPNKKYPTLLYCQGGPQSAVSQFFSYRWNFQLMASNDYIIVAPNRRGLPSFGQAWNDEISGDWGGQCMQDYLSAIDAVKKEPYVNADKLGAIGASFGGYSVFWLAGNHNKRFKTFIAHAGVFNLESAYGTTEEVFFNDYEMQGPYWDAKAKEEYQKFSPHNYVKNWDTPILITHGELDFRVPFSEGIQAFQAAQLRNIPSKFVMFPDEGHWITKPQNSLLWQREFYSWLDKWLK